jgi:hypothetical protein
MRGPLPLAVRLQSQCVGACQERVHKLGARDCALTERAPLEVSLNLSYDVGVTLCRGALPTRSRSAGDPAKGTLGGSQMSSKSCPSAEGPSARFLGILSSLTDLRALEIRGMRG